MKIRIIATPPGQSPEWVREAWVGLELPLIEDNQPGVQTGVLLGKPENIGGYRVDGKEAIEALEKHYPSAAEWWKKNVPNVIGNQLVFKKEVCEVLQP